MSSHYGWVLYRTTQFREDLKWANTIKFAGDRLPAIRDLWIEFQSDLIKFYEREEVNKCNCQSSFREFALRTG